MLHAGLPLYVANAGIKKQLALSLTLQRQLVLSNKRVMQKLWYIL